MSSYRIHNSWLMGLQMDFPLANKFTIITNNFNVELQLIIEAVL